MEYNMRKETIDNYYDEVTLTKEEYDKWMDILRNAVSSIKWQLPKADERLVGISLQTTQSPSVYFKVVVKE